MSAAERPWWASEGDALAGDEDPVEAHRRARRPADDRPAQGQDEPAGRDGSEDPGTGSPDDGSEDPGARPADDGSWWVPASEAVTRLVRDLSAAATASPPRGLVEDLLGGRGDPSAEDDRPRPSGDGGGDGTGGHTIDACGVCPICVGLRAIGEARPDLVVHLTEAARQLALAVRAVVDAAADGSEAAPDRPGATPGRGARRDGLQHIDLEGE